MGSARRSIFEPENKIHEESVGVVKISVKSMGEGAVAQSRGRVAKPVSKGRCLWPSERTGERFPQFAVELTISWTKFQVLTIV